MGTRQRSCRGQSDQLFRVVVRELPVDDDPLDRLASSEDEKRDPVCLDLPPRGMGGKRQHKEGAWGLLL